jgi:hypothetical protein
LCDAGGAKRKAGEVEFACYICFSAFLSEWCALQKGGGALLLGCVARGGRENSQALVQQGSRRAACELKLGCK